MEDEDSERTVEISSISSSTGSPKDKTVSTSDDDSDTLNISEKKSTQLVQISLTQFGLYFIFLIIFSVQVHGMISSSRYYLTKAISELFVEEDFGPSKITFEKISQIEDIWIYLEEVLISNLHWNYWYGEEHGRELDHDSRNIFYENKLIGVPRLRQVKVRNDSCKVHPDFQRTFVTCYDAYSTVAEDRVPFGPMDSSAWIYNSAEVVGESSYRGRLATYGGGGYYVDLTTDEDSSKALVEGLKKQLWITRGTRAVFIDFTVYNANVNLFCIIRLIFELPPTGGVFAFLLIQSVKLIRYFSGFDHSIFVCEIALSCFLLYLTVLEIMEVIVFKLKYLRSLRNFFDIAFITLGWTCFGLCIDLNKVVQRSIVDLVSKETEHASFQYLRYKQITFENVLVVCYICAWIKLMEYLDFTQVLYQMTTTVSRCIKDIAAFSVLFLIMLFAFAQLGYLLFGTHSVSFSSPWTAVLTLLCTILGDFNFEEVEKTSRTLGPVYFVSFMICINFVLINMFLAIVADTYSLIKAETTCNKISIEIFNKIRQFLDGIFRKLSGSGDETASKSDTAYNQIKQELKKCFYPRFEIARFLSKHNVMKDKPIEEKDAERIIATGFAAMDDDDEEEDEDFVSSEESEDPSSVVPLERYYSLKSRIDRIERSIIVLVTKMNFLLELGDESRN